MTLRISTVVVLLVAALTWIFPIAVESSEEQGGRICQADGNCVNQEVKDEENTCTIYLAPTSLKDYDGYGIFTTKAFSKGSLILPADAPNVPVIDPWQLDDPWAALFNLYWWGDGISNEALFEGSNVNDYGATLRALANHHPYLSNLVSRIPAIPYDDSLVNRADPGAGAFSYHMGKDFYAKTDIEAAQELFIDENWEGGDVLHREDFLTAGKIMERNWDELYAIREKLEDELVDEAVLETMLSTIRRTAAASNLLLDSILPSTRSELDRIAEKSKGKMPALAQALAEEVSTTPRSVEWIIENGRCLDNIVPGRSTLPHAGRGGFARRFIADGDVVVPVPLLQIMDTFALGIFSVNEEGFPIEVGTQLLLNYCFGHEYSSLLLCPLTNAMLINHCSTWTKECGLAGANAKLRWDTSWDKNTKRWLDMTLDEMSQEHERGLAFEVVATRDILPGEEIFINYGEAWEDAWQDHVETWKPSTTERSSVKLLNENAEPVELLPDDAIVFTGCLYRDEFSEDEEGYREYFYWSTDEDDEEELHEIPNMEVNWVYDDNGNHRYRPLLWDDDFDILEMCPSDNVWEDLSDEEILWHYGEDGSHFVDVNNASHWPCYVVSDEIDGTCIVRIFKSSKIDSTTAWHEQHLPRFLTNYPRRSIRYFNSPYQSDVHLPGAFRHHIEIRDDIFPAQWKDLDEDGKIDDGGHNDDGFDNDDVFDDAFLKRRSFELM